MSDLKAIVLSSAIFKCIKSDKKVSPSYNL